ncbi:hypothetical protein SDRG_13354 [Saprolegnia diclina VS20]|uniref:Glutamate/phenylalanine/leucine/valine/L-tryptophan dehydrogenase C-terminal domain-containing protein n=1 Tax=Saprolegnia diclina (strain VS20) TaxID=1156394 RepID=T0Q2Q8_SAPDV|nr:hypothetical protein SDRG_13354 [Saprolegnia diclina VS20]EQC28841.1 hypothetical protein SDRG_13354 [Saprolegnia diclina VS20]|eukprot:XP_008617658.1 hypothetical protein SDRG_13354 [Saprolegnia diclina VS20]
MLQRISTKTPAASLRSLVAPASAARPFSSAAESKDDLTESLQSLQKETAAKTVPWFLENMPAAYFRAITKEDRLHHLNAITSLVNAQQPEILLSSPDKKVYSYIRTGEQYPGLLSKIIEQLPNDPSVGQLARVKIFSSLDDTLALDVFRFGRQEPFRNATPEEKAALSSLQAFCKEIQDGKHKGDEGIPAAAHYFEPAAVEEFASMCNTMYIQYSNPRRLASQIALFNRVRGTEGVVVDVEHGWEHKDKENKLAGGQVPQTMLTMACSNVLTKHTLQRAATYLSLKNLNIRRAHLDVVDDRKSGNGTVSMVRILVSPSEEDHRANVKLDWKEIAADLKYLKWLDDRPLNMALKHKNVSISHAEIITTYAHMLHGMLAKVDPYAYSLPRILEVLNQPQHVGLAAQIADLFLERFDPNAPKKMSSDEFNARREAIKIDIRRNVEAEDTIRLLNTMVDAVGATLRTNRYVKHRYALALRMDPSVLGYGTVGKESPYGVFFINGRKFKGFHVRFRDIARGGLRVVSPPSADAHALESARQYNEAYNLAFAQQLKNKDIPEGGSKAVVLVEPHVYNDPVTKNFIIRKSVKAFSDALLDLNTTDEAVKSQVVDFYGKDELIYLGPDENIIPDDITWMTKRAAYRGYPIPRAFISSKPDVGINHKVYGVTSEGVAVFADVALRSQNIDPKKQPFTVKITGGTDGDVAGNIIKILARDYGTNFRVVGICDGTATVESPEGIDMDELLRLVDESLPLSKFDASKKGDVILADTPEGIRARNSLHNRVKSDLFIPAGGRPNTINEHNWREYLDPATGKASSPLIVEGANLFTTPEARQALFDNAGVVIVKDSSANKCGVICSSYEIVSSMLLEPQEFLDIKDELVDDVVKKLRQLALVEAELLFREYKQNPNAALPPSSERISRAITRLHDSILANFDNIAEDNRELLDSLIAEHLPAKLRAVALDRVNAQVPLAYIKCIVAAGLASKIVYREGLQYVETLPESNLANIAVSYLKQEKKVQALVGELGASNLAHREEMADLLIRGGVRAGVATL